MSTYIVDDKVHELVNYSLISIGSAVVVMTVFSLALDHVDIVQLTALDHG